MATDFYATIWTIIRKQKLFCNFPKLWWMIKYWAGKEGRWKTHYKPKCCLQNNHMPSFTAERTFHTLWSGALQVSVDITIQSHGKTCFLIWKLYLKCTTNTSYIQGSIKRGPKTFRRAAMDAFTYSKNVFPSIKVLNMGFDFSFTMSEDCY